MAYGLLAIIRMGNEISCTNKREANREGGFSKPVTATAEQARTAERALQTRYAGSMIAV